MDLKTAIKKARDIKDNSINSYIISLTKLNDNKTFDDLDFLKDKEKIKEKMENLALTTKKNRITAIIVALGAVDEEKYKDLIEYYKKILEELTALYFENIKKNIKTDKEDKNWTSLKSLKKVMNAYKRDIAEREILKKNNVSNKELMLFQNYLITALYLLLPPIRLDYAPMTIIKNKEQMEKDKNYLLNLSRNKKRFIIQEFKNSKNMGTQEIPIPKELNSILNNWLKLNKSENFLINNRGGPLSSNGLGKLITKVFKPLNKNINLGLLRKIYISEHIDKDAIKKAENLASKMLHSPQVQQDIYFKKD
jgi:hypothetical protein